MAFRASLLKVGRPARLLSVAALATSLLSTSPSAQPAEPPTVQARLDLDALLTDDRVLNAEIDDPVWRLEPTLGREALMLPLQLSPPDSGTVELSRPPIEISGARFVGWWIPTPAELTDTPGRRTRTITRTITTSGTACRL